MLLGGGRDAHQSEGKAGAGKDILWGICRAVIQLIIVGYVLKYIFGVNRTRPDC